MRVLTLTILSLFLFAFPAHSQSQIMSADGVEVTVHDRSRIITVGGSITETVYALGAGDLVIAVDASSTYPADIQKLPRVPYKRNLTAEGLLSLNPSLILAADDVEPVVVIEQLREAGVDVVLVKDGLDIERVSEKLAFIGKVLDKKEEADALIRENRTRYEESQADLQKLSAKPKVMFVLSQQGPSSFMIAGLETEAEAIIRHAGGVNAFQDFKGYKPVTTEALALANPDVILFMDSRREALPDDLSEVPGLNLTKAARNNRVISMEGNLLLGFGPRFGEAVQELMQHLHPNIKIDN
jgi:iron complex transport system substrate-binding protein